MAENRPETEAILFDLGNVVVEVDFRRTFRRRAAAMNLKPEQILFLDDNPANVAGAARAGLQTAQVCGEAQVLAELKRFQGTSD